MENFEIEKVKNAQIKEEFNLLNDVISHLYLFIYDGVSLLDSEKTRLYRRAQYIHHIIQVDFDFFVTLTFKDKHDKVDEVALIVKKLFDKLSSKIYTRKSQKRVIHYSAIERHKDGSLHVHVLIKDPDRLDDNGKPLIIEDLIRKLWKEITGTDVVRSDYGKGINKKWIQFIYENGIFGLAMYLTKDCYRYDDTIIYDLCCLDGRKPKYPK